MARPVKHFYEFGPFRIDIANRLLLRDGEPVALTIKAFDTLLALVENSGQVVEKDELMRRVWPDAIVEENNLTQNVSALRKVMGEDGVGRRYIETLPRRGYRFAASVREVYDDGPEVIVGKHTRSRVIIEEQREVIGEENNPAVRGARTLSPSAAPAPHRSKQAWAVAAAFAVVALIAAAAYLWFFSGPAQKTLAVLPFKPLSGETGDGFLELGMADALITRLSSVRHLIVRPTSSVLKYAGAGQDALAAGRELGVESVLDGSLQQFGERVRVTARLIRVSDGAPVWADTFDESFTNIFALQDAISERITRALAVRLTGEERRLIQRRYTENIEAYQAYLRGRFYWAKWTTQSVKKSIEQFEQALKIDPNYALAYAGLGNSYSVLGYLGGLPPKEAYPKGKEAALKALEIDNGLGEAYIALAHSKLFYDRDWAGAASDIERGLGLSPNYPDAHGFYGAYLTAIGRLDQALSERKRAQELDPLSPFTNLGVGWVHFYARRYDQAIENYKTALELDPNFITPHNDLGNAYSMKGMYDEAVEEYLKAKALAGEKPETMAALRQAYAASGIRGYWQKELEVASEQLKQGGVGAYRMARICAALGDKDRAFEWLERALEERNSLIVFIKVIPFFDDLRPDPRFASLVERIGLAR